MVEIILIGARPYNFVDEKSSQQITGMKLVYLDEKETGTGAKGYFPIIINAPFELCDKLEEVPGIYNLEFTMKPDGKGRPKLVVKDLEYVKELLL